MPRFVRVPMVVWGVVAGGVMVAGFAATMSMPATIAAYQEGAKTAEPKADKPREFTGLTIGGGGFNAKVRPVAMVYVFPGGRRLSGFSSKLSQWQTIDLEDPLPYGPVVGNGLACCRAGKFLYGFSSEIGMWDRVELKDTDPLSHGPVVGDGLAFFRSGKFLYGFSSVTGVWDRVELRDASAAVPALHNRAIQAEEPGRVHMFGYEGGRWSTLEVPVAEKTEPVQK